MRACERTIITFAAARFLPRGSRLAGAWYLLAGLGGLALASESGWVSPWLMGLPYVVGQTGLALVMHRAVCSGEVADAGH